MFEKFADFDKILVTGPQRSGTRICAKMIAHDLGYTYIDEDDLHMENLYMMDYFLRKKERNVVQCPALCRYIHIFDWENTAVILIRRNIEDIIASQKRIGWRWEWLELARYDRTEGVIAEVKYQYWEKYQKRKIKHAFEIDYESLAAHPLWVPRDSRQNFKANQTSCFKNNSNAIRNFRPIQSRGIFYCEQQDNESAVLVKTTRNPKKLNVTGRFIWNLCDGILTYQDILQELKEHFADTDEKRLADDLDVFINGLVSDGFLQFSPGDNKS